MSPSIFRVLYVCEFWIVLLATHVVWPQAGGQGHLDVMAWYWKLFLPLGLAAAVTGLSVAAVDGERFWNRKTALWLLLAIAFASAMSGVTYHYHLHENDNIEDAPPEQTAAVTRPPSLQLPGCCR